MSTQQQHQRHAPGELQMYAGTTDDGKERIATELQTDWFTRVLEHDLAICNNCFSKREESARHFRSSGGAVAGGGARQDATADLFCTTCEAGTGKPGLYRPHAGEWDDENEEWTTESGRPAVDYSNVHCQLGQRFIDDMAGTVGREWDESNPLPKNGQLVSFHRLVTNIGQRLEEQGYEIDDWDALRDAAVTLKEAYPANDRAIFARVFAEHVERLNPTPEFEVVAIETLDQ